MHKKRKNVEKKALSLFLMVLLTFPPSSWSRSKKNKRVTRVAIAGFRADNLSFEDKFRRELSGKISSSRNLVLSSEETTQSVVSEQWDVSEKDSVAKVRKAKQFFARGKKLYDQLSLDKAIIDFNRAVIGYREGIGALRDNRYLLVSHLYLGMSLIVLGRAKEGSKYIREMIILDSNREKRTLSRKEFSPKIIQIHRNLTKKVLSGPRGKIELEVTPADANVYLNGKKQQKQRQLIFEVPVGEHFLVVEKKGYRKFAKRILVSPGLRPVSVALEPWRPFRPYSFERRNNLVALDDLKSIAKKVSADVLVLGSIGKIEGTDEYNFNAQLFDARSKEFSKVVSVDFSERRVSSASRAIARKVLDQLTQSGLVIADLGSRPRDKPNFKARENNFKKASKKNKTKSSGKSIFKKTWFWGAVAGVVAVGVGSIFLLKKDESDFNILDVEVSE